MVVETRAQWTVYRFYREDSTGNKKFIFVDRFDDLAPARECIKRQQKLYPDRFYMALPSRRIVNPFTNTKRKPAKKEQIPEQT